MLKEKIAQAREKTESLVSVIVPVYNVEKHLFLSVESMLSQTYPFFELLLIDDGSTDASLFLAKQYQAKDARIRVFTQENQGPGKAREKGIQEARGEYLLFLDADDAYHAKALEFFIKIAQEQGADLVLSGMSYIKESQQNFEPQATGQTSLTLQGKKLSTKEALLEIYYGKNSNVSFCSKFIKKELCKALPPAHSLWYEDLDSFYHLVLQSKQIYLWQEKPYFYYRRSGSITMSYQEKSLYFFDAFQHNVEAMEKCFPKDRDLKKALAYHYVAGAYLLARPWLLRKEREKICYLQKEFLKRWREIVGNPRVSIQNQCKYLLFCLSPQFYFKIYQFVEKNDV